MITRELPQYADIVRRLTPALAGLPPKLIAIDGPMSSGKTTLGRHLAWRFKSYAHRGGPVCCSGVEADRAQEHPAHGSLYRTGTGPVQGLLALRPRPSASEVLRLQSSSRSGRRRECIGCVSRGSKLWISGIGSSVDPTVEASIAATRFLSHCLSDSRLLPMYSERTSVRKPPKYQSTHPTRNSTYRTNFTPAVFPCHQTSSQGRHRVPAMSNANSKWVGIAASPETTILAPFE